MALPSDVCMVCLDRRANCVIGCGHELCHACLSSLRPRICPKCRTTIVNRPTLRVETCDEGIAEASAALDVMFQQQQQQQQQHQQQHQQQQQHTRDLSMLSPSALEAIVVEECRFLLQNAYFDAENLPHLGRAFRASDAFVTETLGSHAIPLTPDGSWMFRRFLDRSNASGCVRKGAYYIVLHAPTLVGDVTLVQNTSQRVSRKYLRITNAIKDRVVLIESAFGFGDGTPPRRWPPVQRTHTTPRVRTELRSFDGSDALAVHDSVVSLPTDMSRMSRMSRMSVAIACFGRDYDSVRFNTTMRWHVVAVADAM